ncbi:MAG: macro domain-containing protein [Deltaproteobacteria bacterium]|nr:macro domain-containing protein [Deltaproteobacteria bacterium]
MKTVNGDLIQLAVKGHFDIIIHGCNCFCTMGAGIARTISLEFPEAMAADAATVAGDRQKLGNYSHATVSRNSHTITIINGYTQYSYAGKAPLADYEAIQTLFFRLKKKFSGKRFGYPKIGAGLAGGDWDKISSIIDQELAGEEHTLVIFDPRSKGRQRQSGNTNPNKSEF